MIEVRPADLGGLVDVTTSPAAVDSSTIWCSSRAPSSGTGRPLAERSAASNYRHPDPDFFVGLDVDLDVGQVFRARARARARGQGPGAAELVGQHPAPLGNPQSRPGDLPGGGDGHWGLSSKAVEDARGPVGARPSGGSYVGTRCQCELRRCPGVDNDRRDRCGCRYTRRRRRKTEPVVHPGSVIAMMDPSRPVPPTL